MVKFFIGSSIGTHQEENVPPQLLQVEANFDANEGKLDSSWSDLISKDIEGPLNNFVGIEKTKEAEIVSAVISLYEDTRSCVRVSACVCVCVSAFVRALSPISVSIRFKSIMSLFKGTWMDLFNYIVVEVVSEAAL